MEHTTRTRGLSLGWVLFIVFLVLKLTHVISWSWWWVTSPLWISLGIGIVVLAIFGFIALVALILSEF
jgi:hypothetical protein